NGAPGAAIADHDRFATRAEYPAVAPLAQCGDERDQVLALGGELVLVAAAVHAGVDARQHAVAHQVGEAAREDVARDRELGDEVGEPPGAEQGLADDEQRPPVAEHLEGAGDRAVVAGEAAAHAEIWLHEETRLDRLVVMATT